MKDIVDKVVTHLFENGVVLKKASTVRVYHKEGWAVSRKEFIDTELGNSLIRKFAPADEWLDILESKSGVQTLQHKIIAGLVQKGRGSTEKGRAQMFLRDSFYPIILVDTGHKGPVEKRIVNREDNTISKISYNAWVSGLAKEDREDVLCADSIVVYDPYDISSMKSSSVGETEVLEFNSYKPPEWRKLESPEHSECPESIACFLEHLFPDDDVREFVLNWLYVALVERNQTYLVLNGEKGTGKGIFSLLASMLVGKTNFNQAPGSLLSDNSDFNKAIKDRRLIVFDEATIAKKEHTKLKKYANRDQNIEAKGVDADETSETFNSFIICNNDDSDMYVEHDDRRFSIVEMTNVPMLKVYTQEQIDFLVDIIENDEKTAYDFGYYIYLHGESAKYSPTSAWKGERFDTLVLHSLSDWKRFLLEYIKECKEDKFLVSDLRRAYKKVAKDSGLTMPTHLKRINDFLKNFRYSDGERIAYTHRVSHKVGYIILGEPDPSYVLPTEESVDDIGVEEVEESIDIDDI